MIQRPILNLLKSKWRTINSVYTRKFERMNVKQNQMRNGGKRWVLVQEQETLTICTEKRHPRTGFFHGRVAISHSLTKFPGRCKLMIRKKKKIKAARKRPRKKAMKKSKKIKIVVAVATNRTLNLNRKRRILNLTLSKNLNKNKEDSLPKKHLKAS